MLMLMFADAIAIAIAFLSPAAFADISLPPDADTSASPFYACH